jgi:PAS domain S-box-containing protein
MPSIDKPLIQATLLADALENGPVGVFVIDDNLKYVAVNRYACELLGYSREELLELTAHDLAPDVDLDERLDQARRASRLEGRSVLRRKDGTDVRVEYRAHETRVAGMLFFVSVLWPVWDEDD